MVPRPITSVKASINADPDAAADARCEHGLKTYAHGAIATATKLFSLVNTLIDIYCTNSEPLSPSHYVNILIETNETYHLSQSQSQSVSYRVNGP